MSEIKKDLLNVSNVFIVGGKRTGKTVSAFQIVKSKCETLQQVFYTFRHPNPELLSDMMGDLYAGDIDDYNILPHLTNCVLLIDEAHKHFATLQKKVNDKLRDMLSTSTQCGVSVLLVSQNFDSLNESLMMNYIDVIAIKKMPPGSIENSNRRYARVTYSDVAHEDKSTIFLHSLGTGERAYAPCKVPEWWVEDVSHAYLNRQKNAVSELFV